MVVRRGNGVGKKLVIGREVREMLGESGAGNWGRTSGSWGRSGRCSGVRTLVEGRGNRGVHRGRRKGRGISGCETAESGTGELNGNCRVGRRGEIGGGGR